MSSCEMYNYPVNENDNSEKKQKRIEEIFLKVENSKNSILVSLLFDDNLQVIDEKIKKGYDDLNLICFYLNDNEIAYYDSLNSIKNVFIVSSIFNEVNTPENILFKTDISSKLGVVNELYSELLALNYEAIVLLYNSINSNIELTATKINSYLRQKTFDLVEGRVLIDDSNYIQKYPRLLKFHSENGQLVKEFIYNYKYMISQIPWIPFVI